MNKIKLLYIIAGLLFSQTVISQTMWKYFSPEDFELRRNRLMAQIGDGILVLQAAELPEG